MPEDPAEADDQEQEQEALCHCVLLKWLIKELGRLDAPGRPMLFGTTDEFLRRFGMDSKESLPPIDPVAEEDFKAEAESEIPVVI